MAGPTSSTDDVLAPVQQALTASDVPRAAALARTAVAAGHRHPMLHNLVAHALQEEGRYPEAMAELEKAYDLAPGDVLILNAIGRCLRLQGRLADAIKIYDSAIATEPGFATSHVGKGDVLALQANFDGARAAFGRAVELAPTDAEALAGLASLELRRGEADEAAALAARALAVNADEPLAALTLAEVETGRGEAAVAQTRLRHVLGLPLNPEARIQAESLLGDALDAEARYGEAFAAYTAAGAAKKAYYASQFARPGAPTVLEMVRWLDEQFTAADPADWALANAPPPGPGDPREHVFFVGFPRSGTTLLEQILASHPEVAVLDERQALADATRDLFTSDAKLARLRTLSEADADTYRASYWRRVADFSPDIAGKVFVDKHPLNSDRLPLVAKLFPNAKVLFAERDPRDVVLSCFRRRFLMNPAMYQLATLDGAATFYDAVMSLAGRYRTKLALPLHTVRYERLVEDLRAEVGQVCDFIGISWSDDMLNFAETARSRGVRTPSAKQVVRGLYADGVGQWRNYAAELAPVLPRLAAWVAAMDYPQ